VSDNCIDRQVTDDFASIVVLKAGHVVPDAACLPSAKGACLGTVPSGSAEWEQIAGEAARTVPGRENGGNCDIKNLSRGCRSARLPAGLPPRDVMHDVSLCLQSKSEVDHDGI